MSVKPHCSDTANDLISPVSSNGANHVVLMVEDYECARPELKQVLKQKGYRVIDTDNGQDAATRFGDFTAVRLSRPQSQPPRRSGALASGMGALLSTEPHQALQSLPQTLCKCGASRPAPLRSAKE